METDVKKEMPVFGLIILISVIILSALSLAGSRQGAINGLGLLMLL